MGGSGSGKKGSETRKSMQDGLDRFQRYRITNEKKLDETAELKSQVEKLESKVEKLEIDLKANEFLTTYGASDGHIEDKGVKMEVYTDNEGYCISE